MLDGSLALATYSIGKTFMNGMLACLVAPDDQPTLYHDIPFRRVLDRDLNARDKAFLS